MHWSQTFPLDRIWYWKGLDFILEVSESKGSSQKSGHSPGLAWNGKPLNFVCLWASHLPSLTACEIRSLDNQRTVGIILEIFSYPFSCSFFLSTIPNPHSGRAHPQEKTQQRAVRWAFDFQKKEKAGCFPLKGFESCDQLYSTKCDHKSLAVSGTEFNEAWVGIPAAAAFSCVTLAMSLNISVPLCPKL